MAAWASGLRRLASAVALALLAAGPGAAQTLCRQALALGLDVSGSVDASEYRLQLDGLAAALGSPAVAEVLLAMPSAPVQLAVFEWSGPGTQSLIVDWTPITDAAALAGVQGRLTGHKRTGSRDPSTALGAAMLYGGRLLAERSDCWKRTLDLSGDGLSNTGARPKIVKEDPLIAPIIINGLVIGADAPRIGDRRQLEIGELSAYFHAHVIHGPGAFVQAALGFADFERAMQEKLLKELEGLSMSARQSTARKF